MESWSPREGIVSRRKSLILLNAAERSRKMRTAHCPLDLATKQFSVRLQEAIIWPMQHGDLEEHSEGRNK